MKTTTLFLISVVFPTAVFAQGSTEDYKRAESLPKRFANKVFREKIEPKWFDEGRQFWYRVQTGPKTHEYVHVDIAKKARKPAFDHKALAAELTKLTKDAETGTNEEFGADTLPIGTLVIHPENSHKVWIDYLGGLEWDDHEKLLRSLKERPKVEKPHEREEKRRRQGRNRNQGRSDRSPDGKWEVRVKDHNLELSHTEQEDTNTLLTHDGTEKDSYSGGVAWSPDSKCFVAFKKKQVEQRIVYTVEAAPKDQLQPKLHKNNYTKPGDELPVARPHLFNVSSKTEVKVDNKLFPNPWSIKDVRWNKDGSRFTFLYNQRGHQVLRIVAVDAASGETSALINEESNTFVHYSGKQVIDYLDESNEIIWSSERDGWHHLYLYDATTGALKNQITRGDWPVRKVEKVDGEKREILFTAGGIYPEQDPYYLHYCRIGFDGSNLTRLTAGDGSHEIKFSPDGKAIIDRYSRVDMPPVTELRDASTGDLICVLEKANAEALKEAGWQTPERFSAKGRDGKTDIFGVIIRPTNFDPEKKYPVIEHIYAGPHSAFVPKRFRTYFRMNSLAELGFIVVQIDGMGTSHRSKAFHDVCWKNLGDSGFPDRILWIKAAAEKYPYMDISKVGVYGGSAGGQSSTRAMLAHGDFYKVAVSDCGCHDNRMDKIWWNEQWMGWPIDDHYKEQSNVTQAHKLQGKLFLIVGALDKNVDPASTMQVVDALIKADKDFDLLVVPGGGHGIAESKYGTRRRRDFFVRHLLGVEPRWEGK